MTNIMIDVETLGVRPGSVILSIGAVAFDAVKITGRYHKNINTKTCLEAGLETDPETLAWWQDQDEAARQVITKAATTGEPIASTLWDFRNWFHRNGKLAWGNGADFDLPIVSEAFRRCGLGLAPWHSYNSRCYRTLKNLRPDIQIVRVGMHHDALSDAESQALHAIALLKAIG